ncbi:putative pectate lyase protein [Neofusicoccum parvum UCRNP2]|uniref:Pectate lyase n=1 Tax=Botryosphaeria parva (strain UCR-NP2) TaxID=1287680 RepID=R1ERH0_BOTPV|nr:putative pectate lyase protein [Neofusicoccum parvum UCRNP2]
MKLTSTIITASVAALCSAQTLNIPTRSGDIITLPSPSIITGSEDFNNQEFDRGQPCNSDEDTGSDNAVFILEDGASISNVIIGSDSLEGVHCEGACTLTNVFFRDVCEDAISALGDGDVLIEGGGAQNAVDKIIQHNGLGTVTVRSFVAINAGKLYRSCGDCTGNGGPRNVLVYGVEVFNITSDLVGINSNFGDTAYISNSCGAEVETVCQEFIGVEKDEGDSEDVDTKDNCLGSQGNMTVLPAC